MNKVLSPFNNIFPIMKRENITKIQLFSLPYPSSNRKMIVSIKHTIDMERPIYVTIFNANSSVGLLVCKQR